MAQRILSVWLPSWATQRLHRNGIVSPDKPTATIEAVRGQRRLQAICPRAATFGLRPGQAPRPAQIARTWPSPTLIRPPMRPRCSECRNGASCSRRLPPPIHWSGLWLDIYLDTTAVNPSEVDPLFERFVSAERCEPPDIDVDFEHERREARPPGRSA